MPFNFKVFCCLYSILFINRIFVYLFAQKSTRKTTIESCSHSIIIDLSFRVYICVALHYPIKFHSLFFQWNELQKTEKCSIVYWILNVSASARPTVRYLLTLQPTAECIDIVLAICDFKCSLMKILSGWNWLQKWIRLSGECKQWTSVTFNYFCLC